jgi:hypothetical protein
MKDVSFHDIVISKNDQKIVSADAWIYDQLGDYAVKPMNELVAVEDMDIYLNNIKNCDGNWYPSKVICPHTMYFTYMKAARENENFIRLTIVDAADLLNAHSSLMRVINIYQAQLDMYEDVYFVYTPGEESVSVFNTEVSDFQTKLYSLSEFEQILLSRAVGDQIDGVNPFAFVENRGIGGVEVFGLCVVHGPAPKAQHISILINDGKHGPGAEHIKSAVRLYDG